MSVKLETSGEWSLAKVQRSGVGAGKQYTDVIVANDDGGEPLRYLSKDILTPRIATHTKELLQFVRFPFITVADLKDKLDEDDLTLLKSFPVFQKLMVEATNVQLGKRDASQREELAPGSVERCRKRARYDNIPEADVSTLVGALMGT